MCTRDPGCLWLTSKYVRVCSNVSCCLLIMFAWLLMYSINFGICSCDLRYLRLTAGYVRWCDFRSLRLILDMFLWLLMSSAFFKFICVTLDIVGYLRDVFVWPRMSSVKFGIYLRFEQPKLHLVCIHWTSNIFAYLVNMFVWPRMFSIRFRKCLYDLKCFMLSSWYICATLNIFDWFQDMFERLQMPSATFIICLTLDILDCIRNMFMCFLISWVIFEIYSFDFWCLRLPWGYVRVISNVFYYFRDIFVLVRMPFVIFEMHSFDLGCFQLMQHISGYVRVSSDVFCCLQIMFASLRMPSANFRICTWDFGYLVFLTPCFGVNK